MAPRIGECLPEILELKVALVFVEFEPMVVVVPFLVESELFHGGVVEDRWLETQTVSFLVAFSLIALSVAVRAHRRVPKAWLLPVAPRPPRPLVSPAPRAFQALAGPGGGRAVGSSPSPQCSYTCSAASTTSYEPTTPRRAVRLTEEAVPQGAGRLLLDEGC